MDEIIRRSIEIRVKRGITIKILVSGLINIETTLKVSSFPIHYSPIQFPFYGVNSSISGVSVNIAKALKTLGNSVELVSMVGNDYLGDNCLNYLQREMISTRMIYKSLDQTPQSVVLYDESGKRQVYCDLKNIQDLTLDHQAIESTLEHCDLAILCNINFSRPLLKLAKDKNKIIATDVHVISDIYDPYNAEFMRYANILFLSHENIHENVEDFVKSIVSTYHNDIIVVGLGSKGALLYVKEDNYLQLHPAVKTRKVVNTIGAGDALFSSFLHYYLKNKNPYEALNKAIVFASHKIGEASASEGFLDETQLEVLYDQISHKL